MKAGIITFHRAYNYGAALQVYALRSTLSKIGVDAEVIDYGSVGQSKRFDFPTNGIKPFIAAMILNVLSLTNADLRRFRFREFLKNYMGVSNDRYIDRNQLKGIEEQYDMFIVGSDQVWNPFLTSNDPTFLLDFVNAPSKKISYAASFGLKKVPKEFEQIYRTKLSEFTNISVREKVGEDIIKELTGYDATVVLDPTFLLNADDWDKIAIAPRIKDPFILCFSIMSDPEGFIPFCKQLSKITGYQIVRIANPYLKIEKGVKTIATAGPREFLGLIKNAAIVVTNSFHGTAFSIIYQKPFYTFLYNNDRDIRLKEIADKLGLIDRLICNNVKLRSKDEITIDYSSVNEKLERERRFSFSYLMNELKENL